MKGLAKLGWSMSIVLSSVLVSDSTIQPNVPAEATTGPATEAQPSNQLNRQLPPLRPVTWESQQTPNAAQLGLDDQLWSQSSDRAALIAAIDYSLDYLQTPAAVAAYQHYALPAFRLERVQRSLARFRQLVLTAPSPTALQSAVAHEFELYQSVGADQQGTVHFTGYFEPIYPASRVPTQEFRYPLYRLPPDLKQWQAPHPTRLELEGADGLQGVQGKLRGLEIVWLRNRLDAYLVQVQGSARLQLTDGSTLSIGYAGRTDYPYVSIGRELVNDGRIAESDLTLEAVTAYFHRHPTELNQYLPRNDRFVFFKETSGRPATGSLRVPVTAGRSIATDKTLMPPGALALIQTVLPDGQGLLTPVSRYVLDQDTGGAIQGSGRVDLFVGTGAAAGGQAGLINHTGQLYYLLLKP
jgi:membrane-bound lytic murein transglycosylase A